MNNDTHDFSTEDEGVDEDMMFEFEQELDARLSLATDDRPRSATPVGELFAPRPRNPVASVLQNANEIEEQEFASLSASPLCDFGSPADCLDDKPVLFDFNGRQKRKYVDDSCCVTPRVRPLAKRTKSFSCVDAVLVFPSLHLSSTCAPLDETKPASERVPSTRSASIQIPQSASRSTPVVHYTHRSSSGPARGDHSRSAKPLDIPAASSDPLVGRRHGMRVLSTFAAAV